MRTRGWTPGSKLVAGPASGLVRCRVLLKQEQFAEEWWSAHMAQVALEQARGEGIAANVSRHGARPAGNAQLQARVSRRRQARLDEAARIQSLRLAAEKVQEEFEDTFSWEERKLIVANSYYTERLALAEKTGQLYYTIEQSRWVMMCLT